MNLKNIEINGKKTNLKIRVKWKAMVNGVEYEGIETEASWFYFDQRGTVLSAGPFKPPTPCNADYKELVPLIKIGNKYLSVEEIEEKLTTERYADLHDKHMKLSAECDNKAELLKKAAKLLERYYVGVALRTEAREFLSRIEKESNK